GNSDARLILLDGPQGWRGNDSPLTHQRKCEHATRTPGKTGLPGCVKPSTWSRMARFSIAMFDELDRLGWPRFTRKLVWERFAIESFPTCAWRAIEQPALPSKAAKLDSLEPWVLYLESQYDVRWPREPTHDELQAVVAGIGGLQLLEGGSENCNVQGEEPRLE